jgi:hypothetical protein
MGTPSLSIAPNAVRGEVRGWTGQPPARSIHMPRYLLSTHSVAGATREPMTEVQMQKAWAPIQALETEIKSAGAWVFSARLHDPDTATVVRVSGDEVVTTDGPFVEAKEHLAGFYIIEAADIDEALGWATKVTRLIASPIEVWPFADTAGG